MGPPSPGVGASPPQVALLASTGWRVKGVWRVKGTRAGWQHLSVCPGGWQRLHHSTSPVASFQEVAGTIRRRCLAEAPLVCQPPQSGWQQRRPLPGRQHPRWAAPIPPPDGFTVAVDMVSPWAGFTCGPWPEPLLTLQDLGGPAGASHGLATRGKQVGDAPTPQSAWQRGGDRRSPRVP